MSKVLLTLLIAAGVLHAAGDPSQDRPEDRAAIRAQIDRIFQAFIHKDAAELRATHAPDSLGYLEGSRTMIHGTDGYMNHSGHFYPNYGMTSYKITEFDMIFSGRRGLRRIRRQCRRANAKRAVPAHPAYHGLLRQAERCLDSTRFGHGSSSQYARQK